MSLSALLAMRILALPVMTMELGPRYKMVVEDGERN
jgi:hypothetical protein